MTSRWTSSSQAFLAQNGEREYEEIEPPDECPACGGEIEEETVSN